MIHLHVGCLIMMIRGRFKRKKEEKIVWPYSFKFSVKSKEDDDEI